MRKPFLKIPSFGTLHAGGYLLTLALLLFGGAYLFLHYVVLIIFAVPVFGAFTREPKRFWRTFSLATLLAACAYLSKQYLSKVMAGMLFYHMEDDYGFISLQANAPALLTIGLIFLPLSAATAISRVAQARKNAKPASVVG